MSFEEALQVLGLSRSDGAAAVRRAYLRRLKKHKPEQDPEGFRRLREALETVEQQPWGWHATDGEEDSDDVDFGSAPESSTEPAVEVQGTAAAGRALVSTAAAEVLQQGEASAEPRLETLLEDDEADDDDLDTRLYECEGSAERLAVCQEYIARHPHDYDGYAYGAHELVQAGRTEEAAALLRRGDALGVPDLLADLIRMLPGLATHAEVERTLAGGTPTDLQERAAFKRSHGDLVGAREDLREALVAIDREGGGVYEHRSQLEAALQYALTEDWESARELLNAHQELIRRAGMERKMIQYDDLLVVQTAELLDQWDALPAAARRFLVELMLQPDEEQLLPLPPRTWRKVLKRLRKECPALHALAEARTLTEESAFGPGLRTASSWVSRALLYWFIIRILLLVIRKVTAD